MNTHMRRTMQLLAGFGCAAIWLSPANSSDVTFERHQDRVDVVLGGRLFTTFHFASRWDKPFLYPLRTPSGLVVSRGWPVEPRPGEQEDHAWHRGLWFGHGDINGQDFWREKPDRSTSRLIISGAPETSTAAGIRVLEAKMAMVASGKRVLGVAGERFAFARTASHFQIDAEITVSADRGQPLRFGDTEDGGFGFRLADEFRQDRGAELMNSDGLTGTEKIWGKPARWVKYESAVNGRKAGVVMLDHPSNLRHPARWHARGYSLCSANPFGLSSFTGDKSVDGSFTLPAGQNLKLRYRVVIYDGALDRGSVDGIFARFSSE